jgi:hypothetical protein
MLVKKNGILFFAVGAIILLRLIFIGVMGLMPQDAYYDFYGEHLALSYYDHPPAIAYILRLFTEIFGMKVFALKLADSFISLLSLIFFYKLARFFLGKQGAQKALLLFFSTLMLTILSLISTPDTPLVLFWIVSLLSLYQAIFLGKNLWWIWSGIFIGLSFDSKYTAIFLLFGLFVFLLSSTKYRRLPLSPWLWLCLLCFLITILPVIIWNVQNDFASFRFQSQNRMKSMSGVHIDLLNFAGVIGHQSAILIPILFFSLIYFLFRLFRKYKLKIYSIPQEKLFLLCFFLPVFIGFLCLSFIYWVKLNWMIPAYISAIIWVSAYISKRWIRYQLIFSLIIHVVLAIEVIFYPVEIKSDDTWIGWSDLANSVQALKKIYPDNFIFSADDYKTSAELNFYLNEMVYSQNIIGRRALQFDFVGSDLGSLKGKNALFIDSDPSLSYLPENKPLPPEISQYFDSVKPLDPIFIKKSGRIVRQFFVYECENYHPKK